MCQAAPWHLQPGGKLCEPGERAPGEAAGLSRRDERREQGQPHELHREPAGVFSAGLGWGGEGSVSLDGHRKPQLTHQVVR